MKHELTTIYNDKEKISMAIKTLEDIKSLLGTEDLPRHECLKMANKADETLQKLYDV